ncbi:hypothetical protein FWK35_00010550, partial [Aphis craccivora]
MDISTNQNNQ